MRRSCWFWGASPPLLYAMRNFLICFTKNKLFFKMSGILAPLLVSNLHLCSIDNGFEASRDQKPNSLLLERQA